MELSSATDHTATAATDDQAAVLAMLRKDAVEYVTKIFDWIEEAGPGTAGVLTNACFDAMEKRFHEVLTEMIARAEKGDDFFEYVCTGALGCTCHRCRYPADNLDVDPRMPWTQLMDNVRLHGLQLNELQHALAPGASGGG
jgi:hypothetical protein